MYPHRGLAGDIVKICALGMEEEAKHFWDSPEEVGDMSCHQVEENVYVMMAIANHLADISESLEDIRRIKYQTSGL